MSVDSPVQITPTTTDPDVGFVQIPGATSLATTLGAKILTDHWRKPELPGPDGLVADFETTLQQKFCDIKESELVSKAPEHGE